MTDDSLGRCELHLERADFDLDVAFELPRRGVLGLFGRSGSGKTTILRCIAGLEGDVRGHVEINGEVWLDETGSRMPTHRRGVGYVFQESRLFPHQTVRRALDYGMKRSRERLAGSGRKEDDWHYTVDLLGIESLLDRKPDRLSGGEKQRVAIARALLCRPQLLLMDEPLASLDAARKSEILPFLERLHQEVSVPIVYVSHSVEEMQRLCDRLIVVEGGRKRFEGEMAAAMTSSDTDFLELQDASALLLGHIEAYDAKDALSTVAIGGGQKFYLSTKLTPGVSIRIRVLATDVSLSLGEPHPSTILNVLRARVECIATESTHHVTLLLAVGEQRILSRISRRSYREIGFPVGQPVFAQVKSVSVHDAL